jgi:hypothetical protein
MTAAPAAAGQTRSRPSRSRSRGSIRGRVASNDGQPLANARIILQAAGVQLGIGSNASTDERGEFQVDDLAPAIYSVWANVPGYVDINTSNTSRYYRLGDTAAITLARGGVITGSVTSMDGSLVVAVGVRAQRVRDVDGRPLRIPSTFRSAETDDRGVYRIYGLAPGSYVVIAGGSAFISSQTSAYAEDAPTYHPSSTRDTAAEVTVHTGQEVTGIDIRYRGEKGQAISGTVSGALPSGSRIGSVNISLVNTITSATEATTFIPPMESNHSFAFYGVPDGEYEVTAQSFSSPEGGAVSPPRAVSVKGADVTGLDLALAPLGSVAGRVVIDQQSDVAVKAACKERRMTLLEENLLTALRDLKNEAGRPRPSFSRQSWTVAPDSQGEFHMPGVGPGLYRFDATSLGEAFYIRSLTLASNDKSGPPLDISVNGLSIKSGERVTGLTITLAEGAASIEGRIVENDGGLPPGMRVVLVPAERENKDKLLRYGEVTAQSDGAFKLNNIAPGRYYLLAKRVAEPEIAGEPVRPLVWDAETRAAVRTEAEQSNAVIELKPCQKVPDYSLRYKAPSSKSGPRKP